MEFAELMKRLGESGIDPHANIISINIEPVATAFGVPMPAPGQPDRLTVVVRA